MKTISRLNEVECFEFDDEDVEDVEDDESGEGERENG